MRREGRDEGPDPEGLIAMERSLGFILRIMDKTAEF